MVRAALEVDCVRVRKVNFYDYSFICYYFLYFYISHIRFALSSGLRLFRFLSEK